MDAARVKRLALDAGFDLAGVASAEPLPEALFYSEWLARGFQGEMRYLEGRRGEMRADPRTLLPSAKSVLAVASVYNADYPYSTECDDPERGWVARYAWGRDYHHTIKGRLLDLVDRIRAECDEEFDYKICVDTSPLLERGYARHAGLGWIAKNTCLIHERLGSWTLLGEILLSLELEPDSSAPYRCGTCTRCIDACPTDALVRLEGESKPEYALDSRRCISYWTIELRGAIPPENRPEVGRHIFGCDICQDVCPWNRPERAPCTVAEEYSPVNAEPALVELAGLSPEEFNRRFAGTPIERSKHAGFLRNVAVAMGNSGDSRFADALRRLTSYPDGVVREHAEWALARLQDGGGSTAPSSS